MRIADLKSNQMYIVRDEHLSVDEYRDIGANIVKQLRELYAHDWADSEAVKNCGGDPLQDQSDYYIEPTEMLQSDVARVAEPLFEMLGYGVTEVDIAVTRDTVDMFNAAHGTPERETGFDFDATGFTGFNFGGCLIVIDLGDFRAAIEI